VRAPRTFAGRSFTGSLPAPPPNAQEHLEIGHNNCTDGAIRWLLRALVDVTFLFFICVYLATWTALLVHSIVLAPLGTRPVSVSASPLHSKAPHQTTVIHRRHTRPVKTVSLLEIVLPAAGVPPGYPVPCDVVEVSGSQLPSDLFLTSHSPRAPPLCV
jgi:hypothetical protein